MEHINLLHFKITLGRYPQFIEHILSLAAERRSSAVYVANVHMFIEAYKSAAFSQIISEGDVVTPDGMPLTWALKLVHGINQDRVAGMDILPELLGGLGARKLPVYIYGGTPELISRTEDYLAANYPKLPVAGLHSPPFRPMTGEEEARIISDINSSGAAVVFVVLGCPKQENWIASMKGKVNAVMIGIGGALPVLIGMQKRAPKWMQKNGLEWAYRFYQEPQRLWKRYFSTNSLFLYLIAKEKLKRRRNRP